MKISNFVLFGLFVTSTSFAQQSVVISCELKINDNQINCPITRPVFCAEKDLKESAFTFEHTLDDGAQETGTIGINEVLIGSTNGKEKKSHVLAFEGDDKAQKLKDDKGLDVLSVPSSYSIDYVLERTGNRTDIRLETRPKYAFGSYYMVGNSVKIKNHFFLPRNYISVSCKKIDKAIHDDNDRRAKAIEEHRKEMQVRQEEKSTSSQALSY